MLLSICIPTTNGRADVLDGTLKSILESSMGSGHSVLEVVVSDNSSSDEIFNVVHHYMVLGLNINYHRSDEKTFYNLIQSLRLARGDFIKLHNDYSNFNQGGLLSLINFINAHKDNKEQVLFTNGNLSFKGVRHFSLFNDFIRASSYWNTWASGFSMWREDFEKLDCSKDNLDQNFPHVSLLFDNNKKESFVINNDMIFLGQEVKGKGGYNIFKLFCVDYPDMLLGLVSRGLITQKTYRSVLVDMRNKFVPLWLSASVYSNNKFTFDNTGYEESLKHVYDGFDITLIKAISVKYYLRSYIKRLFNMVTS
ncbi:glycosyltransferase [Aeromonas veronii]|uniref:glycosyltransferase n=1 Tax=Aeromonas veronii TaxID=654 RepID=UPI003F330789